MAQSVFLDLDQGTSPSASIIPAADNTFDLGSATFQWRSAYLGTSLVMADAGIIGWNDLFLTRESAAVLQMGVDAAGVTNQMLKGPDRITSDGVGGNLTIAGGRNRGAFAGGSINWQTSPAAGAGVTGTLATRWSIDSTAGHFIPAVDNTYNIGGAAAGSTPGNSVVPRVLNIFTASITADNIYPVAAGVISWGPQGSGRGRIQSSATGQITLYNTGATTGVTLDGATDNVLKVFDRAGTAVGSIGLGANLAIAGIAPTAAGTGMAFTVGTGSTSFDWSITISTANAQSAFTLTLPTATNAWTCVAENFTNPGSRKIVMSARTTASVTLTNYSQTVGTAAAFADGDVIVGTCTAH